MTAVAIAALGVPLLAGTVALYWVVRTAAQILFFAPKLKLSGYRG